MALRSELESRAANSKTVADCVALALEAQTEPADADYARELLSKAEMQSQFPADYIATAEGFARGLNDTARAEDLYGQAEEACFEAGELAALGHSIAVTLGNKDKARELLQKAAADAKDMQTFLMLAKYANEDLQDAELAREFTTKVESQLKTPADYRKVVEALAGSDPETAKALYKKAARLASGIPGTVEYAKGILDLFNDQSWAGKTLADLESDCQFPKDFVQLAAGYKQLCNDAAKARELLAQGEDLAMTAEEHIDQARGWIQVLGDKQAAAAAFERALKEVSGGSALLDLARTILAESGDRDLAKRAYAKAETKMTGGSDIMKLAQAVIADLGDTELAGQVYAKAEGAVSSPADLMSLAGEVLKHLGDKVRAGAIYRKAESKTTDLAGLLKLADEVLLKLVDKDYARQLLLKAEQMDPRALELLQLADRAVMALGDQEFAQRLVQTAEDRVASLDEMRKVAAAVKSHFAQDADWAKRVDNKVAKREANQAKYNEFQTREAQAATLKQYLQLVHEVMEQLEDPHYARKLLSGAENLLSKESYNFDKYRDLAMAVSQYLKDADWTERLFDQAAMNCHSFSVLQEVARSAVRDLADKELGRRLARKYAESWAGRLSQEGGGSVYDYTKLAALAGEDLEDTAWARDLLTSAEALVNEPLAAAHLAALIAQTGDAAGAQRVYIKAAELCGSADDFKRLAHWISSKAGANGTARELYALGGERLKSPTEKLRWAEGVVEIFKDIDWARRAYDAIASSFGTGADKRAYQASRKFRLDRGLQ